MCQESTKYQAASGVGDELSTFHAANLSCNGRHWFRLRRPSFQRKK